jgi:hypothetical protein
MSDPQDAIYKTIIQQMINGKVVPLLGAGVNLCERPEGECFKPDAFQYLPSGVELAEHLANRFYYQESENAREDVIKILRKVCPDLAESDPTLFEKTVERLVKLTVETKNLVRISQYIDIVVGSASLYDELHAIFDAEYPPTSLHTFLATLPNILREKGHTPKYPLIVTTNYDDLLERAFKEADEPFDVVTYIAEGPDRGKFLHWPYQGDVELIEKPNEYDKISIEQRSVILKLHGTVDRKQKDKDSFVITEDHYIDYLTLTNIGKRIPAPLLAKLRTSHFMFLGYSLTDWNLRVILHRIWTSQALRYNSWAIQVNPNQLDKKFWNKKNVDIIEVPLDKFLKRISNYLQ